MFSYRGRCVVCTCLLSKKLPYKVDFLTEYLPTYVVIKGIARTNGLNLPGNRLGIFPIMSKIKHSCTPNSIAIFCNEQGEDFLTIRTVEDISNGDQITISFINVWPISRYSHCHYKYHIDCLRFVLFLTKVISHRRKD